MPAYLVRLMDRFSSKIHTIQTTCIATENPFDARRKADILVSSSPDWLNVDTVELVDALGRVVDQRPIYGKWHQ